MALLVINLSRGRGHALAILLFSLAFYYWSSGFSVLLLVASILGNWLLGLAIARYRWRGLLVGGIGLNLVLLALFKYAYFIADNLSVVTGADLSDPFTAIVLPIGISFFTFQGVSYLIDVWRGDIEAERDPVLFGAYLSFFPQLIAGPIVRFQDVMRDYLSPKVNLNNLSAGAARFTHGLFKKVFIADSAGLVADASFAISSADLTTPDAWLGAFAYSIQIYFDFSAYSDMAIGLGRMCGIRFLENFKHPYSSSTITEFWRRWHISLSTWFRDYLYIPLGGSRSGRLATYRNLLIVFITTGFWHGAAWNFLVWGLYHGGFLVAEKLLLGKRAASIQGVAWRFIYVFPVILVGWVLFRAATLEQAWLHIQAMVSLATPMTLSVSLLETLTPFRIVALGLGALIYFMPRERPLGELLCQYAETVPIQVAKAAYVTLLLGVSCILVLSSDFSPFLYFRF